MKKCGLKLCIQCKTILWMVYYPITKWLPTTSLLLLIASWYHWRNCHTSLTFQLSSKVLPTTLLCRYLRSLPACYTSHSLMSGTNFESNYTLIFNHPLSCPAKWFKHTLPAICFPMEIVMLCFLIHHINPKVVSILASSLLIGLNSVAYTIAQVQIVFKP